MAQHELSGDEQGPFGAWLDRQSPRALRRYGAVLVGGLVAAGAWAVGDYSFLGNGISAPLQEPSIEQFSPDVPTMSIEQPLQFSMTTE